MPARVESRSPASVDTVAQSLRSELPIEGQLIAACIETPASDESRARGVALAGSGLDWERVVSEAAGHFISVPVYSFLTRECADLIPVSVAARLRAKSAVNAITQLRVARELLSVYEALSAVGLEVLALKGPALAVQAYGDLTTRHAGDIDILVRQRDLPKIARILGERGYLPKRYEIGYQDFGFFRSFEDQFWKRSSTLIDLHVALLPRYFPLSLDDEAIWNRAVEVELDGRQVRTLAPDDHLIFSIGHATKHGWGWAPLRAMHDIAALSRTEIVDWERNEFAFEHRGCGRMLRLSALLAETFAGAKVPAGVLERARSDESVIKLARQVGRRLFPAPGLLPSVYCDWIVPLCVTEGWRRRVRYFIDRGLYPTIEDWEALPLPRRLYWMYYLTRPARLLAVHGRRFFQLRPSLRSNEH